MEFNIFAILAPVLAGGSFILKRAQLRLMEGASLDKQRDCLHAEFLPPSVDSLVEFQYRIPHRQGGGVECLDCGKRFPDQQAGRLQARRRVEANAEVNGYDGEIVFRS